MRLTLVTFAILLAIALTSCRGAQTPRPAEPARSTTEPGGAAMAMSIISSAFVNGATIPKKYTCDGNDLSPPLAWSGVPDGTKSLALICDDPDAPMGTWVHWVLWGMPASTPSLPEGVPKDAELPGGMKQGLNSWPRAGYGGPCPPPGKPHRYLFKLYALDQEPELPLRSNKEGLLNALKGHILAEAQMIGMYGR